MKRLALILLGAVGLASACKGVQVINSTDQLLWFENGKRVGSLPDGGVDDDGAAANAAILATNAYFTAQLGEERFKEIGRARLHVNGTGTCPDGGVCQCFRSTNAFGNYDDGLWSEYCDNTVSVDVVGHESTHGVLRFYEARFNVQSVRVGEQAAIEEATADFFGERGECNTGGCDWLMGTSVRAVGRLCLSGCAPGETCDALRGICSASLFDDTNTVLRPLRSMSDPRWWPWPELSAAARLLSGRTLVA